MTATKKNTDLFAWMALARVYQRVQRRETTFLAQFHLTLAQFDVLAQLVNREGISQQQLADYLLVTKGNVCGLVDRMSDQGWLERRSDPTDRRSKLLYLTEAGRALAQQVIPAHDNLIKELLASLPSTDQRKLFQLLRRLERKVR